MVRGTAHWLLLAIGAAVGLALPRLLALAGLSA